MVSDDCDITEKSSELDRDPCEADAIASIVERVNASEFPLVLPGQQTAVPLSEAQDLLAWVQKVDAVKIQSFMNARYQVFRASLPAAVEKPEGVIHAEWARDSFYVHLKEYAHEAMNIEIVCEAMLHFENLL